MSAAPEASAPAISTPAAIAHVVWRAPASTAAAGMPIATVQPLTGERL
jgi:hypothetical protein